MLNTSGLAMLVAVAAIGLAGYALLQDRGGPSEIEDRLAAIEVQLDRLEHAAAAPPEAADEEPTLVGRMPTMGLPTPGTGPLTAEDRARLLEAGVAVPGESASGKGSSEEIRALVDEAVEKKAAQIRTMAQKKPPIDLFAKTLALDETQRRAVEEEIVRGQREIKTLLETPTEDGTVFMDEFVEVLAHGMAEPGKNPERWMKLFGRILTEKIPGTDETYAERAEGVKQTVRDGFRREMSAEQYAVFEAWQMDPTEVQDIEYSPWKDVEGRVKDRARALGAEIPDDE